MHHSLHCDGEVNSVQSVFRERYSCYAGSKLKGLLSSVERYQKMLPIWILV